LRLRVLGVAFLGFLALGVVATYAIFNEANPAPHPKLDDKSEDDHDTSRVAPHAEVSLR
jgi:hypothetical protein